MITIDEIRRARRSFRLEVLAIPAALLAVALGGCKSLGLGGADPQPVQNLSAADQNGTLVITWTNPVDYRRLQVTVTGAQKTSYTPKVYGQGKGPAVAVVENAPPGKYTVEVASYTGDDVTQRRQETTGAIEKSFIGYVDPEDLGRREPPEPLDVLFLVHPDCPFASRAGARRPPGQPFDQGLVFQEVADNVLAQVFHRVVRIQDEQDLEALEDSRNFLLENGKTFWLFDPAAIAVVDYRRARDAEGGGVPGQLHLRILNLKLAREDFRARSDYLFSKRALVSEGYQEINGKAFDSSRSMVLELQAAWRRLLKEVLGNPRYLEYKKSFKPGSSEVPLTPGLEMLYFGKVPEQKGPDKAERIATIERQLLFGPSGDRATEPSGPAPAAPPSEAAPRESKKAEKPAPPKAPAAPAGKKAAPVEEKEEEKDS